MTPRRDPQIQDLLAAAVPAPDSSPYEDWEAVLARVEAESSTEAGAKKVAAPKRRARLLHRKTVGRAGVVFAAAAVAIFAAVLFWPSAGKHSVLDRALAAVGDGPVIHVVYRFGPTGTLVNLETGERTPQYGEREEWLSPSGALRIGVGKYATVRAPGKLSSDEQQTYTGILDGYRDALANGTAKLSGLEEFRGRDVYWVRFKGQTLFDVSDQRNHVWSYEVAIDATTYKPVDVRHARDGRPDPITGETIALLETLPVGSVDFTPTPPRPPIMEGGGRFADITAAVGTNLPTRSLGGTVPLWLGSSSDGVPLVLLHSEELIWGPVKSPQHATGLQFCYGKAYALPHSSSRPARYACDQSGISVVLEEATQPTPNYNWGLNPDAISIPKGSVLLSGGNGNLIENGLYIHISAPSEAAVLAAARALRPLDTGSGG